MEKNEKDKDGYTGYEYRDMTVKRSMAELYEDNLTSFGWQVESCSDSVKGILYVTLHLKRDRLLRNRAELTRLQRQFENEADDVRRLEISKRTDASAAAFGIGIIGTAFMAGSVFGYLDGRRMLMILLAVPAFAGWIVPYFCYSVMYRKKSASVVPLIEAKYDEIYETGRKAHALLGA